MWLVGITQPNQELVAKRAVERQGHETYLPRFAERYISRRDRRVRTRVTCLFPRYLFVWSDGHWRFLQETFGMSGVVRTSDEFPVEMPDAGIQQLRSQEERVLVEGVEHRLIRLPDELADRFKPVRTFARGRRLLVKCGPMHGLTGVCASDSGKARVAVLLSYLGRQTSVLIPRDALEAA